MILGGPFYLAAHFWSTAAHLTMAEHRTGTLDPNEGAHCSKEGDLSSSTITSRLKNDFVNFGLHLVGLLSNTVDQGSILTTEACFLIVTEIAKGGRHFHHVKKVGGQWWLLDSMEPACILSLHKVEVILDNSTVLAMIVKGDLEQACQHVKAQIRRARLLMLAGLAAKRASGQEFHMLVGWASSEMPSGELNTERGEFVDGRMDVSDAQALRDEKDGGWSGAENEGDELDVNPFEEAPELDPLSDEPLEVEKAAMADNNEADGAALKTVWMEDGPRLQRQGNSK